MSGATKPLRGRSILVVEDEYFIADEIVEALEEAGATVVGPLPSAAAALKAAEGDEGLDGALLDVNLRGEMVWPVVEVLKDRGVPMVLATGYDSGMIPPAYAHLIRCEKPVEANVVVRALARALSKADPPG
ncbi:response regulator [Muricoccus radiodurans]|uniref:response regulator n=1 Tax=Muricoccus radiodurans TaxID=2231721 RepID=UPI003CED1F99